ncbi:MAG TPA: carbamoyltransferase HypF [Solirubrobacteraceae bacterium]|nr:carbamoyltransferase HypF [Solirubrobacteraceae bacterium]
MRIRVEGTVQGVGFRPYVFRLANELGLAGWVLNDARGVLIEAEGPEAALRALLLRLGPEAPPLAVVERTASRRVPALGERGFAIRASRADSSADAPVAPDTATCEECLRELFDPSDRRYRYPFINCTNCGPRFTIVRGVPYDRPLTTMAGFAMCKLCRAEYEDPADRRFHAQPNACPVCGPSVRLLAARRPAGPDAPASPGGAGEASQPGDPIAAAARALLGGAIVAVKGIGGYHLACLAGDESAVARLRARKHREDRPFALMAASLPDAARLVALGDPERELLASPSRPIVLAPRLPKAAVATSVAPGLPELGVMLPYSPLHHLLLADLAALRARGLPALVMTSGNVSDEPIAYRDDDALTRLAGIADLLLTHDRPIETRTDDSVARVVAVGEGPSGRRPMLLRRSRGWVPSGVPLPGGAPAPLLACGAQLKCTFCLAKGSRAWVSHHIGDLSNYETLCSFTEGIAHFQRLFDVRPRIVAHDLHPEYLSTKWAMERDGVRLVGVQHHHAHLAACLAEHDAQGPAVGAIFDGSGLGADGTIWGGEILYGDAAGFERVGTILPVPLPGGERAIRQPWRMACAWLVACGQPAPPLPAALRGRVGEREWRLVAGMAAGAAASPPAAGAAVCPLTSSAGRLFDAISALCGLRAEATYEGQAAVELEAACDPTQHGAYPVAVHEASQGPAPLVLDPREAVAAAVADSAAGVGVPTIAARFHNGLAAATAEACIKAASVHSAGQVVLSGGVFQNRRLLEAVAGALRGEGLRVLIPSRLPANDGGISYGQAVVAARRCAEEAW